MQPGNNGASARKKPSRDLTDFISHLVKPTMVAIARAFVGVQEQGHNGGKIVEAFQTIVGDAEGEPWCMSFIQACLALWEARTGRISIFPVTEHCQTAANRAKKLGLERHIKKIVPGDIVIWRRVDSTMGHAEIVVEAVISQVGEGKLVDLLTVGGNTGAHDPREGDGVYLKARGKGLLPGFKPPEFYRPF
jgi:hypothetical protein